MKFIKQIFGTIIFFLFLLTAMGCKENNQNRQANQKIHTSGLDTASVHADLRKYEAQNLSMADPAGSGRLRAILKESKAMEYHDKTCSILMDLARFHADQGNFDSTFYYFEQARPFCNKPIFDKTLPAAYLAEFGAFYQGLRSDIVAANNSYYQALNYLKENDLADNKITISIYLYLFATQENLGHPEQALMYLKEAESLAKKLNVPHALISVRTNLGNYYSERKDFKTARKYYDLALESVPQKWNPAWDPNILIAALVGKASVHTKTGEAATAIPYLKRAIQTARDKNIVYSEVVAKIELGEAYNRLGRYQETIQLVTHALRTQGDAFNWYKEEGYRVLMEAYEGLGQFKPALDYQRKLYAFNDSLTNKETTVALNELDVKYQTAIKDKDLASKSLLIEQQHNRISRKNILIAGISGAAVLIVLILVMLYKNAAHKQKLQALEIETLRRQQEINILRSTMQGEEQERKRLSRELHDGVGSMLASAIMRLSLLKKQNPVLGTEDYDEVMQLLRETGSEVRKTAHNIRPDIVDRQSLPEAVKGFCDTIAQSSELEIDVQFYGDTDAFSSHAKHVIYRIIQELVHNVVKHARATEAIVQGVVNEDTFTLTVEDNGTGFNPASDKKGIGLKNVESRIRSLFGDLQVESAPGKGTTVYMEFDCRKLMQQEVPQVV